MYIYVNICTHTWETEVVKKHRQSALLGFQIANWVASWLLCELLQRGKRKKRDRGVQENECTRGEWRCGCGTGRNSTHCNTLPHTATHCHTLQHTATHCNILQHPAIHCSILQNTATHYNSIHYTATHCNTLQHTATHCNTPFVFFKNLNLSLSCEDGDMGQMRFLSSLGIFRKRTL